MTAAMIDRLTHKSYMLNMNGRFLSLERNQGMVGKTKIIVNRERREIWVRLIYFFRKSGVLFG